MKIVVVGGCGLIGSKLVATLTHDGHDIVAASRRSGVDAVRGEGLPEVLSGAAVVVDVLNSPSFEDVAVMKFLKTSTHNLLTAEAAAGVKHHVALSVVGVTGGPRGEAPEATDRVVDGARRSGGHVYRKPVATAGARRHLD